MILCMLGAAVPTSAFRVRSRVQKNTNACDQKIQISRFAAMGKVRSKNSDLACDQIGPTQARYRPQIWGMDYQRTFLLKYLDDPRPQFGGEDSPELVGVGCQGVST